VRDVSTGAYVTSAARTVLEDVTVTGTAEAGIAASSGRDPTVRRCRTVRTAAAGLVVDERSRVTFEECEFLSSAGPAIQVSGGATPVFDRAVVRDCADNRAGVLITEDSAPEFTGWRWATWPESPCPCGRVPTTCCTGPSSPPRAATMWRWATADAAGWRAAPRSPPGPIVATR
jgi:hypothetical protein